MAPDTTRNDGPRCGQCGLPMTPENARKRPELFLHDACLPAELTDSDGAFRMEDVERTITITSLQRELAEARREVAGYKLFVACVAEDCEDSDYQGDAQGILDHGVLPFLEERGSSPGPSDAKGEPESQLNTNTDQIGMKPSLTPLTSPIVRGVLVDDGPVRNVFDYGECYLDLEDGSINTCWENARDPWSHNMQPVKLRPASEFGVPAKEPGTRSAMSRRELEQRHQDAVKVHHDLQSLAESLDVKESDVAGTGLLVQLIKEQVAKLKKLADDRAALLELNQEMRSSQRDRLIETVQLVGRSRETAIDAACNDNWKYLSAAIAKFKSTPAEPAQKLVPLPEGARVIVRAKHGESHWVADAGGTRWRIIDPTLYGVPAERVAELESEVARLEIMGHEAEGRLQRSRSDAERLRKAIETADAHYKGGFSLCHVMAQLRAALTPPTAASGEKAFQIDPAWLMKMADAEDAVGGLAIGVSPFVSQPPSAPAAESDEDEESDWRYVAEMEAAYSEEYKLQRDASIVEAVRMRRERDALSARLAACEERCKELEGACRNASGILEPTIRGHVVSNLAKAAFDTLQGVLAPKAE